MNGNRSLFRMMSVVALLGGLLTTLKAQTPAVQLLLDSAQWHPVGGATHADKLAQAMTLSQATDDKAGYVATWGALALHHFQAQDDSMAMVALAAAQNYAATHLDSLHPSLAYSYTAEFLLLSMKGDPTATTVGARALAIVPEGFPYESDLWNYLLNHYFQTRHVTAADSLLNELATRLEHGRLASAYRVLWLRGKMRLAHQMHNHEKAVLYGEYCVQANDSLAFFPSVALGPICVEIGRACGKLKRFSQGIAWMQKGLKYADLAPNDPVLASYYINIANLLAAAQRHADALDYYSRALPFYEADRARYGARLGVLYQNIGLSHRALGAYDASRQAAHAAWQYNQSWAVRLLLTSLEAHGGDLARGLDSVQAIITDLSRSPIAADPYSPKGNPERYASTQSPYWMALALSQKGAMLLRLAQAQNDTTLLPLAQATLERSNDFHEVVLYEMQGYSFSQLAYAEWVHLNWLVSVALHVHWAAVDPSAVREAEALHAMEQSHYWSLRGQQEAAPSLDERKRYELVRAIALWEGAPNDSLAAMQMALRATYQALERSHQLGAAQTTPPQVALRQLQATLAHDEQMVYYVQLLESVVIAVVDRSQVQFVQVPLPAHKSASILADMAALSQLLDAPLLHQKAYRERFIAVSHRLYGYLVAPIAMCLRADSHLILIPAAEYRQLPFELLLPTSQLGAWSELDFWVRHHSISYHYSGEWWRASQSRPAVTNGDFWGLRLLLRQVCDCPVCTGRMKPLRAVTEVFGKAD